jgi:hypothetical protein
MSEQEKIVIYLVKTPECCFITDCLKNSGYDYEYHRFTIQDLYFDGEKPETTFAKNWLRIKHVPKLVERQAANEYVNRRYELKDQELESEKLPRVIPYEEKDGFSGDIIETLYRYQQDALPLRMEPVDVEIQTILTMEDYVEPSFKQDAIGNWNYADRVYSITSANLGHQLLDKVIFPELCLAHRPCSLSSQQVYEITRQYVLSHIDTSVAEITSNYDFCFDISKLVPKVEPETITYQNILGRTKREREKVRTAVRSYSKYKIFQMTYSPRNYDRYTPIPAMYANSEEELKEKIDEWLETLMSIINAPIKECSACKGTGLCGEIEVVKHSMLKEISDRK